MFKILLSFFSLATFAQTSFAQQKSEEEILFFNRIADFWEEGEKKIAKNQILEFLASYPNSSYSDILSAALGTLYLEEKKPLEALESYAKIKDAKIASEYFTYKIQCLYDLGWYAILADECEAYLESQDKSSDIGTYIYYYLAIGLYHQCADSMGDPDAVYQLATRAKPYFEILMQTSKSAEVATAYAHLCCMLKDFSKAASIYRELAVDENKEEMLFQSALIQAEYDKSLAIQTFQEIIDIDGHRQQEASYNLLVLSFEMKLYENLLSSKNVFLEKIPENKRALSHLFFGRSYLAIQKPVEACAEIQIYLDSLEHASTESMNLDLEMQKTALISMLEASFQARDSVCYSRALKKMEMLFPLDDELLNGKFFKAELLVQSNNLEGAEKEFLELMSLLDPLDHPLKQQTLIELCRIRYLMQHWESCRSLAKFFVSQFPNHIGTSEVGEYLIASSTRIAQTQEKKEELVHDLNSLLSLEARSEWQMLLAKTYISLHQYMNAISTLEKTLQMSLQKAEEIEANLLFAICQRDGLKDFAQFCKYTEIALGLLESIENSNLIADKGTLHASLYNAYLQMSTLSEDRDFFLEKAKTHLFSSFHEGTPIEMEALLWLAECYVKEDPEKKMRATVILESIVTNSPKEALEKPILSLSRLYFQNGKEKQSIDLLEELMNRYKTSPFLDWKCKNETALLLGEQYAAMGQSEKAFYLFDSITRDKSNLKTEMGALACLQSIRLQMEQWKDKILNKEDVEVQKAFAQLKDLVLQKNLSLEPLYLEAALDYLELSNRCHEPLTRKLLLLQKTKKDFESCEDLLSKDYHEARKLSPQKDAIYQSYMQFFEAEILLTQSLLENDENEQKELQAKAKDLLLRIVEGQVHPALVARANKCLHL